MFFFFKLKKKLKYDNGEFGPCPNLDCRECGLIPFGESAKYNVSKVFLYCPCCEEVYIPALKRFRSIDGAAFGPKFPYNFLSKNPTYLLKAPVKAFNTKSYGFELFTGSHHKLQEYIEARKKEKEEMVNESVKYYSYLTSSSPNSSTSNLSGIVDEPNVSKTPTPPPQNSSLQFMKNIPYPPIPVPSYFQKCDLKEFKEYDVEQLKKEK